jgi:hypothetical protein
MWLVTGFSREIFAENQQGGEKLMQYGTSKKRFAVTMALALIAAIVAPPVKAAQKAPCTFITFTVPSSAGGSLSVSGINNKAEVVGYYTISSGTYGFMRSPNGTITPVADPANTGLLSLQGQSESIKTAS